MVEFVDVGEEVPNAVLAEDAAFEVGGQEACLVVGEVLAPLLAALILVEGDDGLLGISPLVEGR